MTGRYDAHLPLASQGAGAISFARTAETAGILARTASVLTSAPAWTNPSSTNAFAASTGFTAPAAPRACRGARCIVGIGGVGSWAVEALARSGVGRLTLIDGDDVCVSNTNRQLHALDREFGRPKVDVMAARARAINPAIEIDAIAQFLTLDESR